MKLTEWRKGKDVKKKCLFLYTREFKFITISTDSQAS